MFLREQTLAAEILGRPRDHAMETMITGYVAEAEDLARRTPSIRFHDEPEPGEDAEEKAPEGHGRTERQEQRLHVVEGDLLLDDDELVVYAARNAPRPLIPNAPLGDTGLVGFEMDGQATRWDEGIVLRYSVMRKSFLSDVQYRLVVRNLRRAATDWERVCGVRFEHVERFDDHDDVSRPAPEIHDDLVFTARFQDQGGRLIAAAFFPTQPPARRKVVFDPSYFRTGLRFNRVGVLRHELGHVLGFRHEHIRSGAPATCPGDVEDVTLFPFGDYDPKSVMHYFCGGVGNPRLTFSAGDRRGAQQLYGPPVSTR